MFITNEHDTILLSAEIKKDILRNIDNIELPDTNALEADLENYYSSAFTKHMGEIGLAMAAPSLKGKGVDILKKIKKFICSAINNKATTDELVDAILQAITCIIPGGIVIKSIVEKIVKLIMFQGIGAFCSVL